MLISLLYAGAAMASPASGGALGDRIEALEREVARLEGHRDVDVLRAAAQQGLVDSVLADADARASLRDGGPTAGHDGKFFIASPDGVFRLELSGRTQLRHVLNHQDDGPNDDTRAGFEMRRTKLRFAGHIDTVEYQLTLSLDREGGPGRIEGPWIKVPVGIRTTLQLGRFRSPLLREETVSSSRALLVERSLVARNFNQIRTAGVGLQWRSDTVRLRVGLMDASDSPLEGDQRGIVAGRAEYLLRGRWKEASDFTSFPEDDALTLAGVGLLIQRQDGKDGREDSTLLRWTADLGLEFGGANAFFSLIGNHVETGPVERDQFGVVVQGGVFVAPQVEIFGQYVWGESDDGQPDLSAVTFGFNRYIREHDVKLTFDVGLGLRPISGVWASSGAGWRRDRPGQDDQLVVRSQLQVRF